MVSYMFFWQDSTHIFQIPNAHGQAKAYAKGTGYAVLAVSIPLIQLYPHIFLGYNN